MKALMKKLIAFVKRLWPDPVWSKVFAAGILALIGTLAMYLTQLFQHESQHPAKDSVASEHAMRAPSEESALSIKEDASMSYLSQDQIRREISKRLEKANPAGAVTLLEFLSDVEAREEEADHIFGYCLKNGKFKEAEHVVPFFMSRGKRDSAMTELQLEKIKR
jgi:hypothetical protein